MLKKFFIAYGLVVLVLLTFIAYQVGWRIGWREGFSWRVEVASTEVNTDQLIDSGYLDSSGYIDNSDYEERLLKLVEEGYLFANLTYRFDESGCKDGVLSIYYQKDSKNSISKNLEDKIMMWMSSENSTNLTIIIEKR